MFVPSTPKSYIGIHLLHKLGAEPGVDFDVESVLEGLTDLALLDLVQESVSELETYRDNPKDHKQYRRCAQAVGKGRLKTQVLSLITEAVMCEENPGIQAAINRRRRRELED